MVDVDKAVIARRSSHGKHFELLVDCDGALAVKEGRPFSTDILASPKVFRDAHKGLEAGEQELESVFGTTSLDDIATTIITKGEIQLTQEYREKLKDTKRKQILNMLHVNGVDPKTHAPHPLTRIETALNDANFHVDIFEPVNEQVQQAMKKLKTILPIKFEIKELSVKISPLYAGKTYPVLKKFGTILKEQWQSNGYWTGSVEIPGGLETEFYDQLNKVTHGEAEVEVAKVR